MSALVNRVVFLVHAIKQFCFGFEQLAADSERFSDGSPAKAFYLNATYHYLAVFYLLDRDQDEMGGTIYKVLKQHELQHLLDPIQEVISAPLGSTTFGEVVRVFRNKVLVHTSYTDENLNRIYSSVDMTAPEIQVEFQRLLVAVYSATRTLALDLAAAADIPLSDLGISAVPE